MGILSNIGNFFKKELAVNPIYIATTGKAPTPKQSIIQQTALAGAIAGIVAFPTASLNIVKSTFGFAVKNPVKTAVGGLIAPVVVGAVAKNPLQVAKKTGEIAQKTVTQGLPALYNVGQNVGDFAITPTGENAKKIFTENPIAVTVLGATGLGALASLGLGGIGVTATNLGLESDIKDLNTTLKNLPKDSGTPSIPDKPSSGTGIIPDVPENKPLPKDKPIPTNGDIAPTTPTETISTGTSRRRKRRVTKPSKVPFVNIRIDNRDNYQSGKVFKPRSCKK